MVSSEFQVIVMAGGKGSRMTELTAGRPKCLLPIGNRPMVWYPLQMLERAGFQEAILVVMESVKAEVQAALDRCGLKICVDLVSIPTGEDWGTADALRFVNEKIKSDVLVVSCDLITDLSLHEVLDIFRKHQAALTALFFKSEQENSGPTPGPKSKHRPERDLVGIDPVTSRLVFLASASDFEDNVVLPKALLKKHQSLSILSRLVDSHLYVVRRWIVQFLAHERSFSTIKGELLPYIVKKQLTRKVAKPELDLNASIIGVDTKKDIYQFASEDALDNRIRSMSTFNDHFGDMSPAYHNDSIRCYAFISDHYGSRANTVASYCEMNRKIFSLWPQVTGGQELTTISPTSDVKSTQVDGFTMIGDQSRLAEKTSIKGCHIGPNCVVEPKVRLTDCILVSGVTVKEGCVLNNCVVCEEAEIGMGCELKDCLVGSHHSVLAGGKFTSEVLTDTDSLMEI